jgi:hypothetical protein
MGAVLAPPGPLDRAPQLALYRNRVTFWTIQGWRFGKTKIPEWACDILIAELEKMIEAIKKEKGPR